MTDYYDKYLSLSNDDKLRLIQLENNLSFDRADDVECPYCGHSQYGIDDESLPYEEDGELNLTCTNEMCGKKFTITTSVSVTWYTQVPDEEAMEMLEKEKAGKSE